MKKTFSKGKMAAIITILAVIIIPMLYSFFYLGAFWDPYSRLEKLPVAVVNKDKGAVINDKQRNAGQEMCDELKKDGSLKFIFTNEKDAKSGTEGKKYYAMIVIPETFSSDIASASTTSKKKAVITYSSNEKRNYLAGQILNRAILEVEEKTRSKINKEIVQELSNKIKDVPDQLTELQDGLDKLNDGTADLKKGSDDLADGTKTYNEKFADYSEGVSNAKDGASALNNGASSLKNGADTLNNGISSLKKGASSLINGTSALNDGASSLKDGASSLDNGLDKLLKGANQLTTSTKDINKLSEGAKSLAAGAEELNAGIIQYTTGVDTLIDSVNTSSAFIKQLVTANPTLLQDAQVAAFVKNMSDPANTKSIATLKASSTLLKTASKQISDGAALLSTNSASLPKLQEGIKTLSDGLTQAKAGSAKLASGSAELASGTQKLASSSTTLISGTTKLADGSAKLASGSAELANGADTLYKGLNTLNNATEKLSDASDKIADGASKLSKGAKKLHNGTDEAYTKVSDKVKDANKETKKLDGLDSYAKAPVSIEQKNINPVPNYGTAFAPYFLSLSLWVGAIIMFVIIYFDADNKFGVLSRNSNKVVIRSFAYLLISLAQAVVLAFCVKCGLGLNEKNTMMYYASCCLVSMVFLSVVQFLMVHLKDVGKFLTIFLLILQLTSCGGTFPMETLGKFYNALYPFMPMTYSVGLFKQAISGVRQSELAYNTGILFAILVVFMTLTILISVIKIRREKRKVAVNSQETADAF